jgi:hypothetical protein
MTDRTIQLRVGHKRVIQRGPKPATGWFSDGSTTLPAEDSVTIPALDVVEPPPDPDPEPVPTGAVGYGAQAKRGTVGVQPKNLTELKAAMSQPDRLVQLTVPIDLGGSAVRSGAPAVTIVGRGEDTMLSNGWVQAGADDLILENVAVWCGDEKTSVDADTFNANGKGKPLHRLLVQNCLFLWGLDVTFVFLNDIFDATVQHSIIAEGLYLSKHPEAVEAQGGHSMALNITNIEGPGQPAPTGVTVYRNAIINNAERNGRIMGSSGVDLIENLLYGWDQPKGFHGNPRSINVVNNLLRSGPHSEAIQAFTVETSNDEPNLYADAVYVNGNQADGFSLKPQSRATRSTPKEPLSVASTAVPSLTTLLAGAGPQIGRGKQTNRLVADVVARRSNYVNGFGKTGSYTSLL